MRRTALVTGAAGGVGALAARRLAAAAWDVVAVDVDAEGLAATTLRSPNSHVRVCDPGDAGAIRGVLADVGPVHRVVHAASLAPAARALDQPLEEVEGVLRTTFLGAVTIVQGTLPGMLERGSGEIILFSSLAAFVPEPRGSAFAAAAAAVGAYATALAAEYGGQGVRFRCACPPYGGGADDHRLILDEVDRSLARPEGDPHVFSGRTPGGRWRLPGTSAPR